VQTFDHQNKISFIFESLSLVENIWPPHLKWREKTFHGHEYDSSVGEVIKSGAAWGTLDMVVVDVVHSYKYVYIKEKEREKEKKNKKKKMNNMVARWCLVVL